MILANNFITGLRSPDFQLSHSLTARIAVVLNEIADVHVKKVVEEGGIKPNSSSTRWMGLQFIAMQPYELPMYSVGLIPRISWFIGSDTKVFKNTFTVCDLMFVAPLLRNAEALWSCKVFQFRFLVLWFWHPSGIFVVVVVVTFVRIEWFKFGRRGEYIGLMTRVCPRSGRKVVLLFCFVHQVIAF